MLFHRSGIVSNFQRDFDLKQVGLHLAVPGHAAAAEGSDAGKPAVASKDDAGEPALASKDGAGEPTAASDGAGENLTVAADADKLSQVVINLVANALKYTNAGGTVTITARADARRLYIMVSDTGIGIASEDLPHIFERFYRTDKSRARQTGGSGIGLTIAKSIVDAHKGSLTVASEPGCGSTFTVILPRA